MVREHDRLARIAAFGNFSSIIKPGYDGALIQEGFARTRTMPNVAEFFQWYELAEANNRVPQILDHMLSYRNNYAMMLGWTCTSPTVPVLDAKEFYQNKPTEIARMLQRGGLGYRFELPSGTYPHHVDSSTTNFAVTTNWKNVAVGRAITNYVPKFYLVNTTTGATAWSALHQNEDIRGWVAGDNHTASASWNAANGWVKPPPGEYELMVALINPSTGESAVQLALPGRDAAGRYPLGVLYVY